MPIRTGNSSARCAATAASTADLGDANAAHTPSPVCLNMKPPCAPIAPRSTSSWAASANRISSGSASHRRVEPSTSVNKNVTTPEGAAAGGADIPAESHSRHAVTPCPVDSRIASRASCAKHPKWHNWHIGTAVPKQSRCLGGTPSRQAGRTHLANPALSLLRKSARTLQLQFADICECSRKAVSRSPCGTHTAAAGWRVSRSTPRCGATRDTEKARTGRLSPSGPLLCSLPSASLRSLRRWRSYAPLDCGSWHNWPKVAGSR